MQNRFYAWCDSGLWEHIVCVLVMAIREADGKSPALTGVMRRNSGPALRRAIA